MYMLVYTVKWAKIILKLKLIFLLQVLCTCKCRSTIIGRIYVQREDEDYFTIYYPLYVLTKAIHSNQECMCELI
jgi:hypothetical protein